MIPRFRPIATAWVRSLAPSLERMFLTWLFTVSSVSESSAAIYFVRVAPRNQPQYINFSWCQRVVRRVLGDFGCDLRGNAFLADVDRANCLQQFLS